MGKVVEILMEIGAFLIVSYLFFYRSWLKYMGKQMAELVTAEDLTRTQEDVKEEFRVKIESYKNELNSQLAEKIEPLKSELAKNNIAYQIEYGHLHKERGKVIVKLYGKLQELHSSMVDWTTSLHPVIEDADKEQNARTDRVNSAVRDFQNYYQFNKLFFQKEFCVYIDDLFKNYWDKGWDFGYKIGRLQSSQLPKEYAKQYIEETSKISKEIREEFPTRIEQIENEFRKMLGVQHEDGES